MNDYKPFWKTVGQNRTMSAEECFAAGFDVGRAVQLLVSEGVMSEPKPTGLNIDYLASPHATST